MVLHGTGGSGRQFLQPQFADELYGPGQPLDISRYYVILPDGIGHGRSSKPSDGLRMRFPAYDYDDMVEAQRRMLVEGLGVTRLRLLMGTSMGCMHGFVWAEAHPDFARAMMPMACLPVEIAGHNRMWRKRRGRGDPQRPRLAGRQLCDASRCRACAPRSACSRSPASRRSTCRRPIRTATSAEAYIVERIDRDIADPRRQRPHLPARSLAHLRSAGRSSSGSATPMTWVNSGDDFINPPDYGIAEDAARRMPSAPLHPDPRHHRHARPRHPHLGEILAPGADRPAGADGVPAIASD